MDNLVFEESVSDDINGSEFISKKWAFVNDNNVGNYSNQIVIDTTPLANTGAYVGWNEAYILMPLVVQLTADTPSDLPNNLAEGYNDGDQSWAFKNGFWQLLHSMQVEFNNQGVVQQFPFLNVFASFKAQTSFSDADVFNHGDGIGFYMDTAESWSFQNNSAPQLFTNYSCYSAGDGVGLCNNRSFPQAQFGTISLNDQLDTNNNMPMYVSGLGITQPQDSMGFSIPISTQTSRTTYSGAMYPSSTAEWNKGMRERQKAINRNMSPINSGSTALFTQLGFGYTAQDLLMSSTNLNQVWATQQIPQTTDGLKVWNIYAKLRLKDLSDFFHKIPLLKGATMRFIMNTNQSIVSFAPSPIVLATPANNGVPVQAPVVIATGVNVIGGMTNPLMVASNAIGQGCSALNTYNSTGTGNLGTYKLSVSIVKCNFTEQGLYSGLGNTALQSCRLYAPIYKMNPTAEKSYLSLKQRVVKYKDVVSYQFSSIPSQSNFNILVSQGIKNICSVLVVPLLGTAHNGANCGSGWTTGNFPNLPAQTQIVRPSTLLSPFSTTGATPDPVILNNFNVAIAGVNVFLQDEMYDFEAFKQQLMSSNQLNGNLTTGLTSGLINEKMFSYLYRYYYANCERSLPTERDVDRSVQVKGRNLCTTAIELLVFVEVEKTIVIDLETGARVG